LKRLAVVLLPLLLLGLVISAIEEAIFRGWVLNQLQMGLPNWAAAIGTSLIFAVLHLIWDGKSATPQLLGLWLMGMVLVLARWVDQGNLGLACGLHTGWIWAMASLDAAQLTSDRDRAPIWLTGFNGQPLAGALGLALLLMTGAVLWQLAGSLLPGLTIQAAFY
jgi:membrane protease YdiL (CAAX protease family)